MTSDEFFRKYHITCYENCWFQQNVDCQFKVRSFENMKDIRCSNLDKYELDNLKKHIKQQQLSFSDEIMEQLESKIISKVVNKLTNSISRLFKGE